MLRSRTFKVVLALCMIIVLAGTTSAFAANISFDSPDNGDLNVGQGDAPAVAGFTVSSFQFVENVTDPTKLDSVHITLDNPATEVKVKIVTANPYYVCAMNGSDGLSWTCDSVAGVLLHDVDTINVIAINNN